MFTERAYQTDKFDNLKKERKKEKNCSHFKGSKIKVIYYADQTCCFYDSKLEKHGQS